MRYKADLTSGSLKVTESRIIAELLLRGVSKEEWNDALLNENVLQTRSPETAKTLAKLIKRRLEGMDVGIWEIIKSGGLIDATHACLAVAVKQSFLLGDFLDLVLREEYRLRTPALSSAIWMRYLDGCRDRDPEMPTWSESTVDRLRSSVFQILAQAGYLENTRSLNLRTLQISRRVLTYLQEHQEEYVLRCIQVNR